MFKVQKCLSKYSGSHFVERYQTFVYSIMYFSRFIHFLGSAGKIWLRAPKFPVAIFINQAIGKILNKNINGKKMKRHCITGQSNIAVAEKQR